MDGCNALVTSHTQATGAEQRNYTDTGSPTLDGSRTQPFARLRMWFFVGDRAGTQDVVGFSRAMVRLVFIFVVAEEKIIARLAVVIVLRNVERLCGHGRTSPRAEAPIQRIAMTYIFDWLWRSAMVSAGG